MNFRKLLIPLVAVLLFATGCTREVDHVFTTYYTVTPGQWSAVNFDNDPNFGYYYASCSCPDLSQDAIDGGAVVAYALDDNGYDNQLPYLSPYYDADGNLFFENVRYDVKTGVITFIIQQSDNAMLTTLRPVKDLRFKVCVIKNR